MSKIKEARIAAGLSRAEMSRRLNIPIRTLEDWEYGKNSISGWKEEIILDRLEMIKKERDRKAEKDAYIERRAKKMMSIARDKVASGESKILNEWRKVTQIDDDVFLDFLEWVYDDKGEDERGMPSRMIALSSTGIKKIRVCRDSMGLVTPFTEDGKRWEGEHLRIPLPEGDDPAFADKDGKVGVMLKICLSRDDQI